MPPVSNLLLFTGASTVLLALPGPAVTYVVTRSVEHGRRAGLVSVLGIELGTFVYALTTALGVAGVLASSATAFAAIRYAGAAYLVVLGIRKLRAGAGTEPAPPSRSSRLFAGGLLVQLLNPKIAIFFIAFLPQFVSTSRAGAAGQMLILGTLFTALALLCDGAYALAAGAIAGRLRRSARAGRRLTRASGCVYIGLGLVAALSGGARSARR